MSPIRAQDMIWCYDVVKCSDLYNILLNRPLARLIFESYVIVILRSMCEKLALLATTTIIIHVLIVAP